MTDKQKIFTLTNIAKKGCYTIDCSKCFFLHLPACLWEGLTDKEHYESTEMDSKVRARELLRELL